MILFENKPVTANVAGKLLVLRYGEGAFIWNEKNGVDDSIMTAREIDDVNYYVNKHWFRVKEFLGLK